MNIVGVIETQTHFIGNVWQCGKTRSINPKFYPKGGIQTLPIGGLSSSLPHYQQELVRSNIDSPKHHQKLTYSNPKEDRKARSSPKLINRILLFHLFQFVWGCARMLYCSTMFYPARTINHGTALTAPWFFHRLSSQTLHPRMRWTAASQRPAMMAAPTLASSRTCCKTMWAVWARHGFGFRDVHWCSFVVCMIGVIRN